MLSNKIAVLTEEERFNLSKILNTKYASYLEGRFFEIIAESASDYVNATVTLRNSTDRFHYPVEGRMVYREQNLSPKDAALFLIDYIDFYFDEFFKEADVYLTIDWSKHKFENKEFFMKGQILNLEGERLADEFLEKAQPSYL